MIYNGVLVSGVQQSDSVIYTGAFQVALVVKKTYLPMQET